MNKHITVGIQVDAYLQKAIAKATKPLLDLPVRWHKKDSLHIMLISLGWMLDDDITKVLDAVSTIATQTRGFSMSFQKIVGVSKNISLTDPINTQIIRLEGPPSDQLQLIFEQISDALHIPREAKKSFKPFITLGRMRQNQWQKLTEHPLIHIPFVVQMEVSYIAVFERQSEKGITNFETIGAFELQ